MGKQATSVSRGHLGERHSRRPTVEGDSHSLSDPVVFDRSLKAGLHSFRRGGGHHELPIFCHNLFVCDLQYQGFYLLDDLLLDGRKMEFLQMTAEELSVGCSRETRALGGNRGFDNPFSTNREL